MILYLIFMSSANCWQTQVIFLLVASHKFTFDSNVLFKTFILLPKMHDVFFLGIGLSLTFLAVFNLLTLSFMLFYTFSYCLLRTSHYWRRYTLTIFEMNACAAAKSLFKHWWSELTLGNFGYWRILANGFYFLLTNDKLIIRYLHSLWFFKCWALFYLSLKMAKIWYFDI